MRKVIIGVILTGTILGALLFYQEKAEPPRHKVVFQYTEKLDQAYSYGLEKMNGEWVTFIVANDQLLVGTLKQNWLGQWRIEDRFGNEGPIGSAMINQSQNKGITWGASGLSKGNKEIVSYYFGMISNPEVDKITLSVNNQKPEKLSLIEDNGKRFFFLKKQGIKTVPMEYKAYSDGEAIASES